MKVSAENDLMFHLRPGCDNQPLTQAVSTLTAFSCPTDYMGHNVVLINAFFHLFAFQSC